MECVIFIVESMLLVTYAHSAQIQRPKHPLDASNLLQNSIQLQGKNVFQVFLSLVLVHTKRLFDRKPAVVGFFDLALGRGGTLSAM